MKKELENTVVDLGCVSSDTKGTAFVNEDQEGGQRIKLGLTDD